MLGQTFSKCMIVLDYQWNKDYIAKQLCVNRGKPEMKCEGKCYLCRKLNKENKKDQENPGRRIDNGSELISIWASYRLANVPSTDLLSNYFVYDERVSGRGPIPFFHPPQG
jgi:hypothetical protein